MSAMSKVMCPFLEGSVCMYEDCGIYIIGEGCSIMLIAVNIGFIRDKL